MKLTVPNERLLALITSSAALETAWPQECQSVKKLWLVLQMSEPSLAEALQLGVLAPPRTEGELLVIQYAAAAIWSVPRRKPGGPKLAPTTSPREIACLEVTDVAAAGRSWLKAAG